MAFKQIEKAWNDAVKYHTRVFKSRVPSLVSLKSIKIEKVKEGITLTIMFTGFNEAVGDSADIPKLKKAIHGWCQNFSVARIKRADSQTFVLSLSKMVEDNIEEAVVKVFVRKNNSIVPAMKCVGGPKNGQRTKDVKTCTTPPSYARRTARKVSSRQNKASMTNKRAKTKLTNIIGRKRLAKANARLKKARGGKF